MWLPNEGTASDGKGHEGTFEVMIRDEQCRALTVGDPSGAEASPRRSFPTFLGAAAGRGPS